MVSGEGCTGPGPNVLDVGARKRTRRLRVAVWLQRMARTMVHSGRQRAQHHTDRADPRSPRVRRLSGLAARALVLGRGGGRGPADDTLLHTTFERCESAAA